MKRQHALAVLVAYAKRAGLPQECFDQVAVGLRDVTALILGERHQLDLAVAAQRNGRISGCTTVEVNPDNQRRIKQLLHKIGRQLTCLLEQPGRRARNVRTRRCDILPKNSYGKHDSHPYLAHLWHSDPE